MSCPRCGGTKRTPIAPGYWECQTLIDTPGLVPSPGDTGTLLPGPREQVCGYRYQERQAAVVATRQCRCGTFAIGECAGCRTAICGDHSRLVSGSRFCADCIRTRNEETAAARRLASEEARQRSKEVFSRFLTAAKAAGHPGARPLWNGPSTFGRVADKKRERARLNSQSNRYEAQFQGELSTLREKQRAEYMQTMPPDAYGWKLRDEHIFFVPGLESGTDTVDACVVLLTTGRREIADSKPSWMGGLPFLCLPGHRIRRYRWDDLQGDAFFGWSEPFVRKLSQDVGIDLEA